jgi:signal transduction histidine kinase
VKRNRVLRTSSFRLALVYAGLTGISFLVLFGVIFLSTARFMRHQIDDSVNSEIDEIRSGTHGLDAAQTGAFVQELIRHSQGFVYLLQDSSGGVIAGNLSALQPIVGPREWHLAGRSSAYSDIRGRGVMLAEGYLFVGWSTLQLREMERFVVGAFLWGLAASVALALAGGLVMSGRLLRRVQAISETGLRIVSGDLNERLPVSTRGDEFDNLGVSVNAMLDRIQSLMVDLRQVTNDIAHDMRTPLTRLRQQLELGQGHDSGLPESRALVSRAITEIDAILRIFAALLRIAQIESGSGVSTAAPVDLYQVIARAVELYRWAAEEKQQHLVHPGEPEVMTHGDADLLMQLCSNLIENAVTHCPPGSTISIGAMQAQSGATIVVADDGPGIAPDLRQKVLQRFFRLESSRTTPGNGLGLSLVAAIVKLHGCRLELSDNSPGLRVSVHFPVAR